MNQKIECPGCGRSTCKEGEFKAVLKHNEEQKKRDDAMAELQRSVFELADERDLLWNVARYLAERLDEKIGGGRFTVPHSQIAQEPGKGIKLSMKPASIRVKGDEMDVVVLLPETKHKIILEV